MVYDLSALESKPPSGTLRVLVCNRCRTIEELPTFDGDNPDEDFLLADLIERHGHEQLELGHERPEMKVFEIESRFWNDNATRREVIEKIRSEEGHTGLGDTFYHTSDTFRTEAVKCFKKHRRPTPETGCSDYRSKSKRLGNSLLGQDDVGDLSFSEKALVQDMSKQRVSYLCDFCPYHQAIMSRES